MKELTESEFADIVNDVASSWSRLESVSIGRFSIKATFRSKSGRSTWDSYFNFDEETWHYTYTNVYPGAAPWAFGDEIQRRIQAIVS
jgi:hypothetical protein